MENSKRLVIIVVRLLIIGCHVVNLTIISAIKPKVIKYVLVIHHGEGDIKELHVSCNDTYTAQLL